MTSEELQRLVASDETLSVEFKGEERSPLNDRELVEAVVCLANCTGTEPAWLLIGVEDDGRLTQKPEPETRATLHRLVEAGLIEERGQKKGRTWHLSAAAYRALGDKAAYVRQRGFEPLQQEQMVLQYVEKHGRITRKEAAEHCRLSPDQAYRLLIRLSEDGRLTRHGSKKGAWYERRA